MAGDDARVRSHWLRVGEPSITTDAAGAFQRHGTGDQLGDNRSVWCWRLDHLAQAGVQRSALPLVGAHAGRVGGRPGIEHRRGGAVYDWLVCRAMQFRRVILPLADLPPGRARLRRTPQGRKPRGGEVHRCVRHCCRGGRIALVPVALVEI